MKYTHTHKVSKCEDIRILLWVIDQLVLSRPSLACRAFGSKFVASQEVSNMLSRSPSTCQNTAGLRRAMQGHAEHWPHLSHCCFEALLEMSVQERRWDPRDTFSVSLKP